MRLVVLLALLLPASTVAAQTTWTVLPHLPNERRAEMLSALRLELAGRATLLEDDRPFDSEATTEAMREAASARSATHAIWIRFPTGVLGPAEVLVLDVTRASAAHGMTPQAWDVVDPRVVAVLAGSLIEATSAPAIVARERAEPAREIAPPIETERIPPAPTAEAHIEAPSDALVLAEPSLVRQDPRTARRFSLAMGWGGAHRSSPTTSTHLESVAMSLAFYGRLNEWGSIGVRAQIGSAGYSSIEGLLISGTIGLPSILVSFREALGTVAMIELGVHAEGGLYFYGRNVSEWSFGVSAGAVVNLELGAHNGLSLDYTLGMFGFGDAGANAWGTFTFDYVVRWD